MDWWKKDTTWPQKPLLDGPHGRLYMERENPAWWSVRKRTAQPQEIDAPWKYLHAGASWLLLWATGRRRLCAQGIHLVHGDGEDSWTKSDEFWSFLDWGKRPSKDCFCTHDTVCHVSHGLDSWYSVVVTFLSMICIFLVGWYFNAFFFPSQYAQLGYRHHDAHPRNLIWDRKNGRVYVTSSQNVIMVLRLITLLTMNVLDEDSLSTWKAHIAHDPMNQECPPSSSGIFTARTFIPATDWLTRWWLIWKSKA